MQRLVCIMHSYGLATITVEMELLYGYIVVCLLGSACCFSLYNYQLMQGHE
jgi:hypothetical protein